MDFTFSPDQDQLRVAARGLPRQGIAQGYVRRMAEHDDAGITPEARTRIVALGWTGCSCPRSAVASASVWSRVVVQEEMGRSVFPVRTSRRRSSRTLAAAISTTRIDCRHWPTAASAAPWPSTRPDRGGPLDRVRGGADGRGNRYRIDGVKPMVMDALTADWLLVPRVHVRGCARSSSIVPRRRPHRASTSREFSRLDRGGTAARRSVRDATRRSCGSAPSTAGGAPCRRADRRLGSGQRASFDYVGTRRVRQAPLQVPGHPPQGGRHAAADRDGEGRRALRSLGVRRRRTRPGVRAAT